MELTYPPNVGQHFALRPTLLQALGAMATHVKGANDPLLPMARVLGHMTAHNAGHHAEVLHVLLVAADNLEAVMAGVPLPLREPLSPKSSAEAEALLSRARLLVSTLRPGGCNA